MKTSVYLTNPDVAAYIKKLGDSHETDLSVVFVRANHEFGLPHDDLAEAMYIAKVCGTTPDNVKTLLSMDYENLLKDAYVKGEIGAEYLTRWMTQEQINALTASKDEEA